MILLKINFWDNFIYKTIFGKKNLNKEIFGQILFKKKISNSIKNISFDFSKCIFLIFINKK